MNFRVLKFSKVRCIHQTSELVR